MVHRIASVVVVALTLIVALPATASADRKNDLWGWLERLSGPGPFHPRIGTNRFPTIGIRSPFCFSDGRMKVTTLSAERRACLYLDYAPWISEEDPLVGGDVKLDTFDVGASYRINRGLELGVGFGVYHFRTEDTSATRVTLTPGRLVAKPLTLLAMLSEKAGAQPLSSRWQKGFATLKWYYKTSVLLGRIDGTDFGIENSPWRGETNDPVSSVGFLIDLGEVFFER